MHDFRHGRQIILFMLGVGLFAMLGAQSQCARVSDNTAGPSGSLVSGGGSDDDCNSDCDSEFKDVWKEERKLFKDNIRDCKDSDDEIACLTIECDRHFEAQMGLVNAYIACIGTCGGLGSFEDCMELCEDIGKKMRDDARKVHKQILRACRDNGDDEDSDSDRNDRVAGSSGGNGGQGEDACQEMEEIRYQKKLTQIDNFIAECASNCHEQGGGTGGQ